MCILDRLELNDELMKRLTEMLCVECPHMADAEKCISNLF